jgi:hypothetical protein
VIIKLGVALLGVDVADAMVVEVLSLALIPLTLCSLTLFRDHPTFVNGSLLPVVSVDESLGFDPRDAEVILLN